MLFFNISLLDPCGSGSTALVPTKAILGLTDGGDLPILGHLQGVLQAPDQGHGELRNVRDVGEDGLQLLAAGQLTPLDMVSEHLIIIIYSR